MNILFTSKEIYLQMKIILSRKKISFPNENFLERKKDILFTNGNYNQEKNIPFPIIPNEKFLA